MCNCEQVGLLTPEPCSTGKLLTAQVGYIITGMKSTKLAQIGDTWHRAKKPVEPLPGFKQSKSMIFAGESATLIDDFAFSGSDHAKSWHTFGSLRSCMSLNTRARFDQLCNIDQ